METFVISVPNQKSSLVKQLLKELGVIIKSEGSKTPNKKTLASMKKTANGDDLTITSSHSDLMDKLNS